MFNPLLGNPDDEFRRPSSSNNMPFCPDKWTLKSKTKLNDDLKYKVDCEAPPSYTGGNRGCGSNHQGYTDKYYVQDWASKCQVNWGPNKCALPSSYCGKGSGYTPESCTNFLKFLDRSDIVVGCGSISKVVDTPSGSEEIPRSEWPKLVREGGSSAPSQTERPHTITATKKPMTQTTTTTKQVVSSQASSIPAPSPMVAPTTAATITPSPAPSAISSQVTVSPTMSQPFAKAPATTTTTTQQAKLTPEDTADAVATPTLADCPNGWALINNQKKTCQAPDSYKGSCDKTQSFGDYSASQKKDWVNKCKNDWGPYTQGSQEGFSTEGKCYEDNCWNAPNSPYFRKPLPACPENWSYVKRDCKYNVCRGPNNYTGGINGCPSEMKFYNETKNGQATGITKSFAEYKSQRCQLNWGDNKFASPLSYRQPQKPQMIQDTLVYNPRADNVDILKKLGIMNNVVAETFSTNYSSF